MKEVKADLWTYLADFRCVTTNGVVNSKGELVMGKGVALQAKKLFPHLPKQLGRWVKERGNTPLILLFERLISFPTKHHWKDKSDLDLIIASAKIIAKIVTAMGIEVVALPRPGCGNGGLDWESEVKPAIADILDDRFVVCVD